MNVVSEETAVSGDADDEIEEDLEMEWETDEETDKKQFGIYQCLPVDDAEPDWDAEEPDSVEEYLRRVRYEAKQLPSIVTSEIDPRQFDYKRTHGYATLPLQQGEAGAALSQCPEELKSSPAWVRLFLGKFSLLRKHLQREDDMLSGRVAGLPLRVSATETATQDIAAESPSALMPELAELRGLDQIAIVRRLHTCVQKVVTSCQTLDPGDAARIYAISARVELPLHSDSCAAYRALLRRCCEWRAEVDGGPGGAETLSHLSILIALAGAYFGQDEEMASLWTQDEEEDNEEEEEDEEAEIL